MDKDKELVLIVEQAQLMLKKLIRDDIILNVDKNATKLKYLELEKTTKLKLEEAGADEEFVKTVLNAFKRTFMLWYIQIHQDIEKLNTTQPTPVKLDVVLKQDETFSGMVIDDSGLKKAEIKNIRDFMTVYEEGAAGYYYDYAKKVDEIILQMSQQNVIIGNRSARAVAETKARYDIINDDLQRIKDKGVKYVVSTAHANASERCQWWQGKIFIVDLDIATRKMGQYKGQKPNQEIKGYIDGKPYYSLDEACKNGFLSYNCQHRLVAYYKGIHLQKYNLVDVKKKRDITSNQRYLERRIREERTKQETLLNPDDIKKAKAKVKELNKIYEDFCEDNNVPRFDWRTKLTPNE